MSTRMPSLQGKGRNELIDINGCGFDRGNAKGKSETDGKDEKAEKITRDEPLPDERMVGKRVLG